MSVNIQTIQDIEKVTNSLYKHTENFIKDFIKKDTQNIACKQGCDSCCKTLRVEILPAEAFLLAKNIKSDFTKEHIDNLKVKLKENANKSKNKSLLEHINEKIECAFLDNGQCSVYNYRPYKCRAFLARDLVLCLFDNCKTEQVPELQNQLRDKGNIDKYMNTIKNSNLETGPAEINDALYEILNDDNLLDRYLNQEKNLFSPLSH